METGKSRKILKILYAGVAGAFLLPAAWGFFVEPNLLTVRRCEIRIPGLPPELEGLRAVLVGDTHFSGSFISRRRMKRLIECVRRERPHTVWLLGDYMAVGSHPGWKDMGDRIMSFFAAMHAAAPLGAYAVLGNHELWYGREKMRFYLEKSGVRVIENKLVMLGEKLALAGVPDGGTVPFDRKAFDKLIRGHDPLILLSHKGSMAKSVSCADSGLVVAADTHGGQIRIPGKGALKEFLSLKRRKKELPPGLSRRWGKRLFVTAGAGGHRLDFRLFCPPEIAVLTLRRGKAER